MKIIEITNQHRRDFSAKIECEGCRNVEELRGGYDDRYYHDEVLPSRKCSQCGKSRNDLGVKAQPTPTKYAEHETV